MSAVVNANEQILSALRSVGPHGMTADELAGPVARPAADVSTRLSRLCHKGLVQKLPNKRLGASGRSVFAWVIAGADADDAEVPAAAPHFSGVKGQILDALRAAGPRGMTTEELRDSVEAAGLTARLSMMMTKGLIRKLDDKRKNRSGDRQITIWAIAEGSAGSSGEGVKDAPGKRRAKVLDALRAAGPRGMTCNELAGPAGISPNDLPSVLVRLEEQGIVQALAKKRPGAGGRKMKVWIFVAETAITADSRPVDFWADIRKRIGDYVRDKSESVDAVIFEQVFRDFEVDMQDLVKSFMNRIKQRQRSQPTFEAVSRRALFAACHTLQVPPPKVGEPADEPLAKRNKRHMVRQYHPDSGRVNNESTRAMYEAVIAAYDTIAKYNDSINRSGRRAA